MMMKRTKMNEIYPISWLQDTENNATIFRVLTDDTTYSNVKDFIKEDNCEILDIDYYVGFSADKYISPMHQKLLDSSDNKNGVIEGLAKIIYNRFSTKWKRIYDALMTNYKPLENYDMEEERTPDLSDSETINTNTELTTERETSASNSYKGFNSTQPVLVNKTDGEESNTTSGESEKNEISKSATHTGTETLTRHGNIGVTTSQQMLESEIKLRQYDFYKQVYKDIDSVLCLSIY